MTSPDEILTTVRDAMSKGDLELAEKTLREASSTWKREPEFAVRHANVLVQMGNHRNALKVYRKVMKQVPERLDACIGAAECAIKVGNGKLAEKLFSRAIGLGMSLDLATAGISRSLIIRSRHHQAWEKALAQFVSTENKSKELHKLLQEISPQVGSSVPALNQFDSAEIDDFDSNIRGGVDDPRLSDNNFDAGSIEAMAGVDRETLLNQHEMLGDDLLSDASGDFRITNLGIDLSAVNQDLIGTDDLESSEAQKIDYIKDVVTETIANDEIEVENSIGKSSNNEYSDDPFDDWPEFD